MEADVLELDSTFSALQAQTTLVQDPLVDTGDVGSTPVTTVSGGNSGFGTSKVGGLVTFVSPLTTKGDLYTRDGSGGTRLPVGANDSRLTADSGEATGLKWIPASTGWGATTGTLSRAAYVSYAGQTVSVGYVQAEVQALDDAVKLLSRVVAALLTDLAAQRIIKA